MPRGCKNCPKCAAGCGPRSATCPKCNFDFKIGKKPAMQVPAPKALVTAPISTPNVNNPPKEIVRTNSVLDAIIITPAGPCPIKYDGDLSGWVDRMRALKPYSNDALRYYLFNTLAPDEWEKIKKFIPSKTLFVKMP